MANPVSGAVNSVKGGLSKVFGFATNGKLWLTAAAFTAACYALAPAGAIAAVTSSLPQATTLSQTASNAFAGLKATYAAGAPQIIPAAKAGAGKLGAWLSGISAP